MLKRIALFFIVRAEKKLGVDLDYVRYICGIDFKLLTRYNSIFKLLDPNRHVPASAYHAARLTGAISADCGTCVVAEINLAKQAGLNDALIGHILNQDYGYLDKNISAVIELAVSTLKHQDNPEARAQVLAHFGDKGLIELSYAINGAALLPGIKRSLGYAISCDLEIIQTQNKL